MPGSGWALHREISKSFSQGRLLTLCLGSSRGSKEQEGDNAGCSPARLLFTDPYRGKA